MQDTQQDNPVEPDELDKEVLDGGVATPADDDNSTTVADEPVEDAEEDVEAPVADDNEGAEAEEPVLGLGDDSTEAPTAEEVAEKAEEKSKDAECEFC